MNLESSPNGLPRNMEKTNRLMTTFPNVVHIILNEALFTAKFLLWIFYTSIDIVLFFISKVRITNGTEKYLN